MPQGAGCQVPRLPTERGRFTPEALSVLFRDWQRTQTQSSVTALRGLRQGMDVRFCERRNPCREALMRTVSYRSFASHALASAPGRVRVPLDKDLHGSRLLLEVAFHRKFTRQPHPGKAR